MNHKVFITGGTGYMGSRLIPMLMRRGYLVSALARGNSGGKLPVGATVVRGDALKMDSYTREVEGCDTFVHLVGVAHPGPSKGRHFRKIDFVSAQVAIKAARDAGIRHFVYLSVAHPAPIMKEYGAVRRECEETLRQSGVDSTFARPWYVLGPGHLWPYAIIPFYKICELIPATREAALRLGLVTLPQMLNALLWSVENPADGVRILDVQKIREFANKTA